MPPLIPVLQGGPLYRLTGISSCCYQAYLIFIARLALGAAKSKSYVLIGYPMWNDFLGGTTLLSPIFERT